MLHFDQFSKPLVAGELSRYVASARAVLSLVRVIGEGVLGLVGSGSDQYINLHNITNHCTRLGTIL